MNHRPERVSGLIMEELGKLILKEIEVEGALATITDVNVTDDLLRAVVKVSVYPTEKSAGVKKALDSARGTLQHLLMRQMNIRPMPQIFFEIDYGQELAARIEKKLLDSDDK